MFIDLEKLEQKGFGHELDNGKLHIYPQKDSVPSFELREAIKEVGAIMGFNERETDELFGSAHMIQVMSTIRRCSNW